MRKRAGIFGLIAGLALAASLGSACSHVVECPGLVRNGECVSCPGGICADAGDASRADVANDAASDAGLGGNACTANSDCDAASGLACVTGTCRAACRSHFDCVGVGQCQPGTDADGARGTFCAPSAPEPVGQFYTRCPYANECDAAHGFVCIGAAVGDLDAFCTRDCSSDAECADGFYCGEIRRSPCEDACGLKGNSLDPSCVHATQIGDGLPYKCDPYGVTRKLCREREFCTTCSQDSDCLAVPNGVCAKDASGASICTQVCDPAHPSCPWGTASVCGNWPGNSLPTCAHRFGACKGTGKGCEPCVQSSDCGAAGLCTSSNFSGERWCIDVAAGCSCGGMADANGLCQGGGCPTSPSGLDMICIDDPKSALDGACYGANTAQNVLLSSQQTGCWPAR